MVLLCSFIFMPLFGIFMFQEESRKKRQEEAAAKLKKGGKTKGRKKAEQVASGDLDKKVWGCV